MMLKSIVGVLLATSMMGGVALAGTDVPKPAKDVPVSTWTPMQQWTYQDEYGYYKEAGAMAFADEMGDKLSQLGRANLLRECLGKSEINVVEWAICSTDARAFDAAKAKQEAGLDPNSYEGKDLAERLDKLDAQIKVHLKTWGEAEKSDPGVAAAIKLVEDAKAEWKKYLDSNKEAYERMLDLRAAFRGKKTNAKAFQGCWDKTAPDFAKVVKAANPPYEVQGDQLPAYMEYVVKDPAGYVAAVSHGACAYSLDPSGEGLFSAATYHAPGWIRAGWRSLAIPKLLDPNFKPKFADRTITIDRRMYSYGGVLNMDGTDNRITMMTPTQGPIGSAKVNGDVVHIKFAKTSNDECISWKNTNRLRTWDTAGNPVWETVCTKRGKVTHEIDDVEVPAKFAAGIAPGNYVHVVSGFPVVVWNAKKKKLVALFGVELK